MNKNHHCSSDISGGGGKEHVELESQFIMRLPPEPAKVLRETLRNGLSLKDRLSIKLENDLRYGQVKIDHWSLHARVVDLPTIVESLKTIDNKSFYKTADICQLLVCKEEDDQTTTDEDSPIKQKKKDPIKVDKKYLWPHGITPPTKNVRKRRFRKTLKKKYVEAPEIEKEVKRLLRVDNEAVNVKWEVICEDEDVSKPNIVSVSGTVRGGSGSGGGSNSKMEPLNETSTSVDVAEHDIFGEAVSDSEEDDDETQINVMELDEENSRLSVDSRVSDSNSMQVKYSDQLTTVAAAAVPSASSGLLHHGSSSHLDPLVTEFSKDMFVSAEETIQDIKPDIEDVKIPKIENFSHYEQQQRQQQQHVIGSDNQDFESQNTCTMAADKDALLAAREQLQAEILQLQEQRRQQESTIDKIENVKLRERFQEIADNLLAQEAQKVQELNQLAAAAAAAEQDTI